MNNYPSEVKETLYSLIDDLAHVSWLYSTNPGHIFMRNGKLDFATTLRLILAMEGGTVNEEMMEFFQYDLATTPTQSAFNQRRSLIKYEAFQQLFLNFVDTYPRQNSFHGYQVLACDGSHVVYAKNPKNTDDYVKPQKEGDKGYNQLHLNALYDIVNRTFVDAIIQPGVKQDEHKALHDMLEHYETKDPFHTIITADRGYKSYNLIAQLQEKNLRFVLRVKDYSSSHSLLSTYQNEFPDTEEFDVIIKHFITRRKKALLSLPSVYKYIHPDKTFDYLDKDSQKLYYIEFRVVRIKLSEDSYECLITNLPDWEFPPEKLKELYYMRWGIESAFRQLKYAVGMMHFHAKKVEYIKQEIFAKLIVYNFSEIIADTSNLLYYFLADMSSAFL